MPITGLSGFVLTSATGAKSRFHPDLRQLRSDRDRHALGELDVVHYAERPVARIRAPVRGLQPGDVTAFLVDSDEKLGALRAQVVGERPQLVAALDVPGVEGATPPSPSPTRRRTQSGATGPRTGKMQFEARRSSS